MGPADFHLFTDGAADGGTERGGGGVVVFDGGGEVERLSLPAGRYCSSFTVEAAAMLAAVRWLGEREGWTTAALITDIMSLLQALQGRGGGCRVENIRRELWDLYGNGKQVGLAWVPGHCGLPGNEAADEMARRGSELAQERVGVDLATRMAVARRGTRRSAPVDAPQAQGGLCWWPEVRRRTSSRGKRGHAGEVQDRTPPGAEEVAGNGG